tara:strand:+ start:166 stop:390 length:225 start_codon:yes stop_codon:yes gene_type:complete
MAAALLRLIMLMEGREALAAVLVMLVVLSALHLLQGKVLQEGHQMGVALVKAQVVVVVLVKQVTLMGKLKEATV